MLLVTLKYLYCQGKLDKIIVKPNNMVLIHKMYEFIQTAIYPFTSFCGC